MDRHGIKKEGIVSFMQYEQSVVDIAVVTLSGWVQFTKFMSYSTTPVSIGQELTIIGLKPDSHDEYGPFYYSSEVNYIEPLTTLFQFIYYCADGMSGSEVVCVQQGTDFLLMLLVITMLYHLLQVLKSRSAQLRKEQRKTKL